MWTHSRVFWITESYCQSTVGTARDRLGMAPLHSWAGVGQGGASKSTSDGDEGEGDLPYCRALEKDDLWWWWVGLSFMWSQKQELPDNIAWPSSLS